MRCGCRRSGIRCRGSRSRWSTPRRGEDRATGEIGELCFRGYSRFEGYYKDPELTAERDRLRRWFHSGDLAYLDGTADWSTPVASRTC